MLNKNRLFLGSYILTYLSRQNVESCLYSHVCSHMHMYSPRILQLGGTIGPNLATWEWILSAAVDKTLELSLEPLPAFCLQVVLWTATCRRKAAARRLPKSDVISELL